jgi:hypothetical protein
VFNRQAYDIAQKRIERDDTVDVGDTVLLIILGGLGAVEGCNAFLASKDNLSPYVFVPKADTDG